MDQQRIIPVKPLNYTGKRIIDYQLQVVIPRLRGQPRNEYVLRLNALERKAQQQKAKRDREKAIREAEIERLRLIEQARIQAERLALRRQKAREAYQRRKIQKNVVVDIKTKVITDRDEYQIQIVEPIITGCEELIGQTHAYIQASQNGVIVVSDLIEIKGNNARTIFWESIYPKISRRVNEGGSDEFKNSLFSSLWFDTKTTLKDVRIVIIKADAIPSEKIKQSFLDGSKHCVIDPLYNLWNMMSENSDSQISAKRCKQIATKIKSLECIYPNGVPEENMEEVAKICKRTIVIHDIIGNEIQRYNKKSSKYFHFTNTRANHLEQGFITIDMKYESVSQEELNKIMYQYDKDNIFYLFTGDLNNGMARSIRSSLGCWAVYNEEYELFKDFSKSLGIKNYGFDAIKYNELNDFCKEARIINSAPTPLCSDPNDLEDVKHIDIEKAYTQHKHAPFYKGFLGHIHQYSKLNVSCDFLKTHTGIFQFKVLKTIPLLSQLGIKAGLKYTLPSPEIEYFISLGLEAILIAGCWGSTFNIEYTDEMLSNRNYCVWAGKLGMDSNIETYTFKGNAEWASHLKAELGNENVYYFKEQNIIVVKIPKKSYNTTHHILAYITSYTRINMLEIMKNIKGDLVKVILDGIYFRGELPDVKIPHHLKETKEHLGFREAWYYPSEINCNWGNYNADLDGNCVLTGAGGGGKSYSILKNKSIINPLYVVPSHVLGKKCKSEYGCNYTTIHKLIGEECIPYKDSHKEPGVIFIDELTMIGASWIEKAIKMYPNSLIYVAGDIDKKQWFQCRNGYEGNFSKVWIPTWRMVEYNIDMRSKDEELKAFKVDIRNAMKHYFTDGGKTDASRINLYVKKNYPTIEMSEAMKMFQPGDIWIAGTHKTNDKLLENGIVSGYIKNKEMNETEGVERGSFTTHSFQGLTIESKKLFVSLDFFEYAMFYTSISRVRNMSQLVIVR